MTDPPDVEPDPALVEMVAGNLAALRARIAAVGRDDVTIVAVTKRHPVGTVRAALAAGLADLGENYAQEMVAKAEQTSDLDIAWHFIGQLQSNKVRLLAPHVSVVHTLDRVSLAAELGKRCPGLRCFVQVDLAGIPGRGGCGWDEVESVVTAATAAGLSVTGLMGVGPPSDGPGGPDAVRTAFERLAATGVELGLPDLSIGMSGDLDIALSCGATVIRIGTALFGQRTL